MPNSAWLIHPVDLLAHLAERRIDALALGLDVLRDAVLDHHARLVKDRVAARHPVDQLEPGQLHGPCLARARSGAEPFVDEAGRGDQLGEHHSHRLQRLDLDIVVAARRGMLDAENADRTLAAHDRTPAKLW